MVKKLQVFFFNLVAAIALLNFDPISLLVAAGGFGLISKMLVRYPVCEDCPDSCSSCCLHLAGVKLYF